MGFGRRPGLIAAIDQTYGVTVATKQLNECHTAADLHALIRSGASPDVGADPDLESLRLLIIGDGEFAEIAYEYFTHDSP